MPSQLFMETRLEKNHGVGLFVIWQNFPVFCQLPTGCCAWSSLGGSPEGFEEAFRNDEPDMEETGRARQRAQTGHLFCKHFHPKGIILSGHMDGVRKLWRSMDLPAWCPGY